MTRRQVSWLIEIISIVLPTIFYTYRRREFEAFAAMREGFTCGIPIIANLILAGLVMILLSATASIVNFWGVWRTSPPHWLRYAECALLLTPCAAAATVVLSFLLA